VTARVEPFPHVYDRAMRKLRGGSYADAMTVFEDAARAYRRAGHPALAKRSAEAARELGRRSGLRRDRSRRARRRRERSS